MNLGNIYVDITYSIKFGNITITYDEKETEESVVRQVEQALKEIIKPEFLENIRD